MTAKVSDVFEIYDDDDALTRAELHFRKELLLEVLVLEESVRATMKSRSIEPNTKDFMEPWYREVGLENVPKDFARTVPLLNFHTVPWGKSTESSESRARKETIASAMCEYSAIINYRVDMLRKNGSASGWLRHYIENLLVFGLVPGKGRPMPGSKDPRERTITWPDMIEFDVGSVTDMVFDIAVENERSFRTVSRHRDFAWIEKLMKTIHQCSFAHEITTNDDGPRKNRPLRPEVREVAERLLEVSASTVAPRATPLMSRRSRRHCPRAHTSTESVR